MAKATPIKRLEPGGPLDDNARKILLARLADVLEWLPRARTPTDVAGFHDLRIAVKRLRYGLEFLRPALGKKKMKPYLTSMRRLQDALGEVTDVDAYVRRLKASEAGMPDDAAREGLRSLVARLEAERERRYAEAIQYLDELRDEAIWSDLIRELQ